MLGKYEGKLYAAKSLTDRCMVPTLTPQSGVMGSAGYSRSAAATRPASFRQMEKQLFRSARVSTQPRLTCP